MSKIPKASYGAADKPLIIGEFEIPCYVLDNEKRVLVQRGLTKALGMSTGGGTGGAQRIVQFVQTKSINPFISKELMLRIQEPIKFKIGGTIAYEYEATILADICEAVLKARQKGPIPAQQAHIVRRAELLLMAFAKVGIIALVDEATGYQEVRERDALKQFLQKFLLEEKGKWIKTYPDEFFEMIFKMKGLTWTTASKGKKPQWIGHHINY